MPPSDNNKKFSIKLPTGIIKKLNDKNVDLVIKVGNVHLEIPLGALNDFNVGSAGEINLEISSVENEEEQTQSTDNNKTHKVVDFKLSVQDEDGTSKEVTEFNTPLQIEVDISDIDSESYDKLGLYYIDEVNGIFEFVGGKINANGEIVAWTNHFSKYAVMEFEISFNDVDQHWGKKYIESMAAKNVINGFSNGDYKPDENITRAQFVKMLVEALDLDFVDYNYSFTDVSKDDWFAKHIATAEANGLITGSGNGKFNPNDELTRLDMTIMLSRAIGMMEMKYYEVIVELAKFKDMKDIPTWAEKDVANAVKAMLITGYNDRFYPNGTATRAEAATVIYRLFNK